MACVKLALQAWRIYELLHVTLCRALVYGCLLVFFPFFLLFLQCLVLSQTKGALRPTRLEKALKTKTPIIRIGHNRKTAEHNYLQLQIHKIKYGSGRLAPFLG